MKQITFSTGYIDEGCLFFIEDLTGLPGKWDLNSNKLMLNKSLYPISNEKFSLIQGLLKIDEMIFTIDQSADVLYMIAETGKKMERYSIPAAHELWGNFAGIYCFESSIYLLMKNNNSLKFNIKKCVFENIKLSNLCISCRKDNIIWTLGIDGMELQVYNMSNDEIAPHRLPIAINSATCMFVDDASLYIYDKKGILYIFEQNTYNLILTVKAPLNMGVIGGTKSTLYFLPCCINGDIYIMNREDYSYKIYNNYPDWFRYTGKEDWKAYMPGIEWNNYLIYTPRTTNALLLVDQRSGELFWKKFEIREDILLKHELARKKIIDEYDYSLDCFILNV